MNPKVTIKTRSDYYNAERTYQQLRFTAHYYRDLLKAIPDSEYIPSARKPYRESDRKYYIKQANKADKEADLILDKLIEYENKEAE